MESSSRWSLRFRGRLLSSVPLVCCRRVGRAGPAPSGLFRFSDAGLVKKLDISAAEVWGCEVGRQRVYVQSLADEIVLFVEKSPLPWDFLDKLLPRFRRRFGAHDPTSACTCTQSLTSTPFVWSCNSDSSLVPTVKYYNSCGENSLGLLIGAKRGRRRIASLQN